MFLKLAIFFNRKTLYQHTFVILISQALQAARLDLAYSTLKSLRAAMELALSLFGRFDAFLPLPLAGPTSGITIPVELDSKNTNNIQSIMFVHGFDVTS